MNKFSLWQGRDKPLTETKRAATFISSFVLLVPFLTGREERWGHDVAKRDSKRLERGLQDIQICLSGNLAHCC